MIKFAIVGTSEISELMCDAISKTEGAETVFVCSRSVEKGRQFAKKMNILQYGSFDEMLKSDADAVYIATPNSLHVSQGTEVLKSGRYLLLEKPASVTEEGIDLLYSTAKQNNVFFMEAITTLFMPNYLEIKSHLSDIGKIKNVKISFGRYSSKYDAYLRGEKPSNLSYELAGGALNDMGVYCVHTAVGLFGMPDEVHYMPICDKSGVDLSGVLKLVYGDFECIIKTAKDRDIDCGIEIVGENGSINTIGNVNDVPNVLITPQKDISLRQADNRMVYEVAAFKKAIQNNITDFFEAMTVQSMMVSQILEKAHSL